MSGAEGPRVYIEGEIRRKRMRGVRPFQKVVWDSEKFEVSLLPGESKAVADDLEFTYVADPHGLNVAGKVRGKRCTFASVPSDGNGSKQYFTFLSIAKIELTGHITAMSRHGN